MGRLIAVLAVALIVLLVWLGGDFGLGLPGGQGGDGEDRIAPVAPQAPEAAAKPEVEEDGVLRVQIVGTKLMIGDQETSVTNVANLAAEKNAKVVIERADDARRRPREELENALRERNIHVVIE